MTVFSSLSEEDIICGMVHSKVAFVGTFDPLHGAHIGQLLRAYTYEPFMEAVILLDKCPIHKPNATHWEHRLLIGQLTLGAAQLPFKFRLIPVESSAATEITESIDRRITGIDSLVDNLRIPERWQWVQRWPMIVLSIPGVKKSIIVEALNQLPEDERAKISYKYVSEAAVPIMS